MFSSFRSYSEYSEGYHDVWETFSAVEDAMVSVEEYHDASWNDIMSTEGCSVQEGFH